MATRLPFIAAARRTPGLWSVGLLGFLARGGLVLILLPMLALPSPVSLSVLIGPDLVDANGLSTRVAALLALAGGIAALCLAAGLVLAALADIAAFRGVLDAAGVTSRPLTRRRTAWLVMELLVVQLVAVVPLLIALVPAATAIVGLTRQEILLPSDQGLPLWWRVAEGTWPSLALVAAMAVLSAHLYTILGRELLARRSGVTPGSPRHGAVALITAAGAALTRRPVRALAASGLVWLAGLGVMIAAAVLIAAGWTVAQAVYLSPPVAGTTPLVTASIWLAAAVGTVVLVVLVALALTLLGVSAAIRSALLTQAALGGLRLA